MKRLVVLGIILSGLAFAAVAKAQTVAQSPMPSLGEIARKFRAERAKETTKPAKVYTNDNIPTTGGISTTESAPGEQVTAAVKEAKAGAEVHDEAYYRKKMNELKDHKNMHQRELAVLEQKISQNQMEYYSDPSKTLEQTSTPLVNSDVNKLRDDIEKKKQQIADDENAISALEEQCQQEGCPAGWVR